MAIASEALPKKIGNARAALKRLLADACSVVQIYFTAKPVLRKLIDKQIFFILEKYGRY